MPAAHAHKGPSKAKLFHACSGALPLIGSIPPEDRQASGDPARMGTAAHHLLEVCLDLDKEPEDFRGRIIKLIIDPESGDATGCSMLRVNAKQPSDGYWYEVDDPMIEGVSIATGYVRRRMEELRLTKADVALETRTNPVPDRDDTWGTCDVSLDAWPILLEVVDYKNGYVLVEHDDNEQLLSYLAGRAHDTQWSHDEYKITVVQPNAFHDEGKVRTFTISRDDLKAFVDKHRAKAVMADLAADTFNGDLRAEVVDDGDSMVTWADAFLTPGEHCDQCMCEARLICPAVKRWKQSLAAVEFDDDPEGKEAPEVSTLAEAVKVLKWAPYLQAHIKLATATARAHLLAGKSHPDLKVTRGRGSRVLNLNGRNPYQFANDMVKEGLINNNEVATVFTEPELKTGPAIEAMFKGKGSTAKKRTFNDKFLTPKPGALRVALATDPGEAVTVNPGDDFDDDPEGET